MRELRSATGRWVARAAALLLAGGLPLAAPPPASAQDAPPALQPVQIVLLVDQSGSLTEQDVAAERDAARVIVQGEPARDSTVSVLGFGSANAPGRSAVDPVCPPTKPDSPQSRQFLGDCVGGIHRRTPAEGDGTDHVQGLRQALSYLSQPGTEGQPKIVFLLTDGVLDVRDSPEYGKTADERNATARFRLSGVLDELNHAGVSVWPLGFGQAGQKQLDEFATGAAQDRCGLHTAPPRATVIKESADLWGAIGRASSSARCTSVGEPVPDRLPPGGTVELPVEVPAIASEGTILVFKRDPRILVSYLDPNGEKVPANGDFGGSHFELGGQDTEAEAMRILNPAPGRWTVLLESQPGVPPQEVGAMTVFQGAVRALPYIAPQTPAPGSAVQFFMRVRGARTAIKDPEQLKGLTLTAELRGDGFAPLPPVELSDEDGDGEYQGRIVVPETATGRLDFVGGITGVGVSGDHQILPTRISSGAGGVQSVLNLDDAEAEVVAGTSLNGSIDVNNATGQPRTIRIELTDLSQGALVTASPEKLVVPPAAGSQRLGFTLTFDPATALGSNQGRIRLVDETTGAVLRDPVFEREVVAPPGPIDTYWWLWTLIFAAATAAVGAVLLRRRRRNAERDVRGIRVELRRYGQPTGNSVKVHQNGAEFRFGVHRGESAADTRITAGSGGDRYQVQRAAGGPVLTGPSGEPLGLAPGGVLELADGVELVVHDRPDRRRAAKPARGKEVRSGRTTKPKRSYDPYDL
ncbi:vWA domain-containing protein [Saccharopolyspora pogona]|uniref:vWA domain-containing protein n=1 Tax=Saccharopolyspora pogona TaxID=333966 RepID=UPI0016844A34|nr:vWA domain-containing protein [Saccharopolyspora pogona]